MSTRSKRLVLFCACCCAALTCVLAVKFAWASCANKECVESSCWKIGTCLEFDYSTAFEDYANTGGGTRTQVQPRQTIQQRTRGSCTLECASQGSGKASSCTGDTGDWQQAGDKYYCKYY